MGCIVRLGCLAILALLGIVGWLNRDRLLSMGRTPSAAAAVPTWERLTPAGAARTRDALARLERGNGPVFATLSGGDVASYLASQGGTTALPGLTDSSEAAVMGDQLVIRGIVPLRSLGGDRVLGPFAGMLTDREPMQVAGRLRVLEPGRSELTVTEIRIRDMKLPASLLARVTNRRGTDTAGTSTSGIPVTLPRAIADVRVADGRITLYKAVP